MHVNLDKMEEGHNKLPYCISIDDFSFNKNRELEISLTIYYHKIIVHARYYPNR